MKRLILPLFVGVALFGLPVRAQFIQSVSGEPITTYDPGFPEMHMPPSVQTQLNATPVPGALNLTGIGAGDAFTLEFRASANQVFAFSPEVGGSPEAPMFMLFRWFQFGVNIGGTPEISMLTGETMEWINASAGAPALSTSSFAFYQSSNNASNVQIDAYAAPSAAFTFEGLRFRATWAVNPNDVTINWFEGGWAQFTDSDYTAPTVTPLVTIEPAPVPEPRDAGMVLAVALGLLVAVRIFTRLRQRISAGA